MDKMISRSVSIAQTALLAFPIAGFISQMPINPVVAQSNRCILNVKPNQTRYPRGQKLSVRVQVRRNRQPVVNTPLLIQQIYSRETDKKTIQTTLAQTKTNSRGAFTLRYRVPKDPLKDKVTLVFVNPVPGGCSKAFVIPIGRR